MVGLDRDEWGGIGTVTQVRVGPRGRGGGAL